MKKGFSALFYIICFLMMVAVIYRLAFLTPPQPSDRSYVKFCLGVAGLAVLYAGSAVGFAALADWRERQGKQRRDESEPQKEQRCAQQCSERHRE